VPDDVFVVVQLLQEHDFPERALRARADVSRRVRGQTRVSRVCERAPAAAAPHALATCRPPRQPQCCPTRPRGASGWRLTRLQRRRGVLGGSKAAHLRVGGVLERVEDLFQRHRLARAPVHRLPHDAVCLRARKPAAGASARPEAGRAGPSRAVRPRAPPHASRTGAHPLPQLLLHVILAQHVLVYLLAAHRDAETASTGRSRRGPAQPAARRGAHCCCSGRARAHAGVATKQSVGRRALVSVPLSICRECSSLCVGAATARQHNTSARLPTSVYSTVCSIEAGNACHQVRS